MMPKWYLRRYLDGLHRNAGKQAGKLRDSSPQLGYSSRQLATARLQLRQLETILRQLSTAQLQLGDSCFGEIGELSP